MLDSEGFDLWADGYDRSVDICDEEDTYPFAGYKKVLAAIYDAIRSRQGKRILDIGFGTGVLSRKLCENGYDITGIDFSQRMIDIAREKMPSARLIRHDFSEGLPETLEKDLFDAIVCTYAIHHLDDESKLSFIRELAAHLTPEGMLYIGDVAFPDRLALNACREACGDSWDEDEYYIVVDQLRARIPGIKFEKISHCAGILTLQGCLL